MVDSFVQVAPDSTGKLLHTRQRVSGTNTVQEQYVIIQSEAVPVNRLWVSSLRIPVRALAAAAVQPLFSIWNGIAGGGNNVSVRRLSVEIDSITAHAVASPLLRLRKQTAASASGSTLVPVAQYSADPALNALVVVRADHQGDSAVATTPLTAGTLNANPMWSQTVPRAHTLAGFQVASEYNLLPNDSQLMSQDPLILRPAEGAHVEVVAGGLVAAGAFSFVFKAVLAEFAYP